MHVLRRSLTIKPKKLSWKTASLLVSDSVCVVSRNLYPLLNYISRIKLHFLRNMALRLHQLLHDIAILIAVHELRTVLQTAFPKIGPQASFQHDEMQLVRTNSSIYSHSRAIYLSHKECLMWERMHIYAIWQKTCSAAQIFF